jgi:recombination protein RecA
MSSAHALRLQIETSLAQRIPAALSPVPHVVRLVAEIGIPPVDELLHGGLPLGSITEVVGAECSGRTSLALSFIARMTQAGKVCAWVDVSNALQPESAASAGVDLSRLLWVRCGVASEGRPHEARLSGFTLPKTYLVPPPIKKGLHGGGFGPHPRMETNGLSEAIRGLLKPEAIAARCAEPQRRMKPEAQPFEPTSPPVAIATRRPGFSGKPWSRIEQALHVTDLLLQAGGFGAVVLDMGSIAPEFASRVPLATWFRYRAAAERSQASILLLTQHSCAKSSAGLVLRLQAGDALQDEATVFAGMSYRVEAIRTRFSAPPSNVIPLRKPPQSETGARWKSRMAWAGSR